MANVKDFGDFAIGRVVDDCEFRLKSPKRICSGIVTTVFPHDPKHVQVRTAAGAIVTIRLSA